MFDDEEEYFYNSILLDLSEIPSDRLHVFVADMKRYYPELVEPLKEALNAPKEVKPVPALLADPMR